jgi:hypothetical protein
MGTVVCGSSWAWNEQGRRHGLCILGGKVSSADRYGEKTASVKGQQIGQWYPAKPRARRRDPSTGHTGKTTVLHITAQPQMDRLNRPSRTRNHPFRAWQDRRNVVEITSLPRSCPDRLQYFAATPMWGLSRIGVIRGFFTSWPSMPG